MAKKAEKEKKEKPTGSLRDRIIATSKIKATSVLTDSDIFGQGQIISTTVPMINVAFTGEVDGGITGGILQLAAPSKHFKSTFALLLAAAFLKKYPDGIILFYDSEFGSGQDYFKANGIDPDRVVHTPITNIEELKFDIITQLEGMTREDHVMIIIDSLGNLASKKEVEDAKNNNEAADMTRAKQLKSLSRIITPHLTLKDIPLIAINHTYKTMEIYAKTVVGGGTGFYYAADAIWVIGRQADKDGKEVEGFNFDIKIEKSRFVKEGSIIPIGVTYERGINRWSGLFEVAVEGNFMTKINKGKLGTFVQLVDPTTGELVGEEIKASKIEEDGVFWTTLLKREDFRSFIRDKYRLVTGDLLQDKTEY